MLYIANLNIRFWALALEAAVYLYNRSPYTAINYKTPYELKYNNKSKLSKIKVWGSIAYIKIYKTKKLDSRAKPCILVGYNDS